jgi:hypothetical protein
MFLSGDARCPPLSLSSICDPALEIDPGELCIESRLDSVGQGFNQALIEQRPGDGIYAL